MEKLKVGHVGGRVGYAELFNKHHNTKTVAICDISQAALNKKKNDLGLSNSQCFIDYKKMLKSDLDIVVIATPMPFHANQSVAALEKGINVLSEVTAATSIEDCERLVRSVRKTGMKYMMAENYFYYHFIQQWNEMIKKDLIGNPFYAEAEYVHEIRNLMKNPKTGELKWRANRPPLWYCSHCLGPILMLLDDYVVKVTASGKTMNITKDIGKGAIDMQVALFNTKKGRIIKMLRSQIAPREPPIVYYSIYGTKGCLENSRTNHPYQEDISSGIQYFEGEKRAKNVDWRISDPDAPEEAKKGGHGTCEYYLVKDFVNSIINDTQPTINVVKATEITIPGLVAAKAAKRGDVWLDVPHFD